MLTSLSGCKVFLPPQRTNCDHRFFFLLQFQFIINLNLRFSKGFKKDSVFSQNVIKPQPYLKAKSNKRKEEEEGGEENGNVGKRRVTSRFNSTECSPGLVSSRGATGGCMLPLYKINNMLHPAVNNRFFCFTSEGRRNQQFSRPPPSSLNFN